MKKLFIGAAMTLFVACHAKDELSREQAEKILQTEIAKSGPFSWEIYTADEEQVAKLKESDLVTSGYIRIKEGLTMMDIGKPMIEFNDRSFLLDPKPGQTKTAQRVKIADMILSSTAQPVISDDGNTATVSYTYNYTNVTPFASLVPGDIKAARTAEAHFQRSEDGWHLQKKSGDPLSKLEK